MASSVDASKTVQYLLRVTGIVSIAGALAAFIADEVAQYSSQGYANPFAAPY